MNSSSYGSDIVHQEHAAVRNNVHPGHTTQPTSMASSISRYFNHHISPVSLPTQQQQATQLPLQTIGESGSCSSHITTHSTASVPSLASAFYDPQQIQLTNALEKTFFNTSATAVQPSTQRFYNSVTPNVSTSPSTNSIQHVSQNQNHSHQQGNTILITNNYAANQYGTPAHNGSQTSAQMQPATAANIPPGVSDHGSGYNNNATGNIRIITTLPDTINHQHQQQNVYNLAKEINQNVRDDIIQLPQFYHAAHQSSTYPQQLSTMLPTHFTQTFTTPSVATAPMHIAQDDIQQQHQYLMAMANNDSIVSPSTATLTSVPKVISNITGDAAAVTDAITPPSSMISSQATTATSNSTLVLDRINICINNHYSDTLTSNNGLSNTSLDANGTSSNSAITSVAHTFATTAHTPQQPSPIIPAIHHKLVLEPVGSSISGGTLQTDSYTSNDSTLVIDEPDSTTTTPHTPPTTPENSSPLQPASNLTSTRTRAAPQQMDTQIIIEDAVINDEENYIIPSTKHLEAKDTDKNGTTPPVHSFTTITQSINLLDDDESDGNSEKEHEREPTTIIISNDVNDDSIMEIEDDDVIELSAPETMRMDNNIKCADGETVNVVSHPHNVAGLHNKKIKTDSKAGKKDSPQSPTHTNTVEIEANETVSSVTLLTPPTPTISPSSIKEPSITETAEISFSMGEDVFIRKDDGRQYLGTVIGCSAGGGRNMLQKVQYLIRFDDNSEMWCGIDQMRRFGSIGGSGNGQMCVACKRTQLQDVVEICDDCRRGYHRSCTRETLSGSGVWWCLRCCKPMKDSPNTGNNKIGRPLTTYKNSYKTVGDVTKSSSSSSNLKTPADVYEFHTDNEVFTSDDEIPIKHIMEKARKTRDSTQHNITNNLKQKYIKKKNNSEEVICDQILNLDDQNANDANSINKITQTSKNEKAKEQDESPNSVSPKATKSVTTVEKINTGPVAKERTSRKRKAFTLSNTYKEVAAEAASKRYDSSRICDSSSDENSSSSRGTSLDVIIPPPKNFLGLNNPFRMLTPKKNSPPSHSGGCVQSLLNFYRSGTMIKNSIFNTTALDFSSKLAELKNAGIFPNISTSNLAKAAGQPRTVRTIKRRLSAKDITIGPNQEVRRRRTRRLSSNVEVISTTTINPIATNFFPIHAKDLLSTHTQFTAQTSTSRLLSTFSKQQQQNQRQKTSQQQQHISASASTCITSLSSASSASSSPPASVASTMGLQIDVIPTIRPSHGRRLRQRPQKNSPGRRSSISSASTSSTNSSSNITLAALQQQQAIHATNNNINMSNVNTDSTSIQDLKQSVKEYFGGAVNRIESGEQFCIRAKRQLANGQMQYLIEWGDAAATASTQMQATTSTLTSPSKSTNTALENYN